MTRSHYPELGYKAMCRGFCPGSTPAKVAAYYAKMGPRAQSMYRTIREGIVGDAVQDDAEAMDEDLEDQDQAVEDDPTDGEPAAVEESIDVPPSSSDPAGGPIDLLTALLILPMAKIRDRNSVAQEYKPYAQFYGEAMVYYNISDVYQHTCGGKLNRLTRAYMTRGTGTTK